MSSINGQHDLMQGKYVPTLFYRFIAFESNQVISQKYDAFRKILAKKIETTLF